MVAQVFPSERKRNFSTFSIKISGKGREGKVEIKGNGKRKVQGGGGGGGRPHSEESFGIMKIDCFKVAI